MKQRVSQQDVPPCIAFGDITFCKSSLGHHNYTLLNNYITYKYTQYRRILYIL